MKTKHVIRIAMAFLAVGIIAACAGRGSKQAAPSEEPAVETCLTAIDRYLTEEIGSQYLPGEICIPFHPYTDIEETDGGDVLVWGDFWVMNYDVAGDTLKTVSGGAHPGMMRVVKTPEGHFEVTSFEQVGDGSDWEPTAKRIFGDRFSDFSKSNSDEKLREQVRLEAVAGYVRDHDLPVKVVKDYGWPAITIPVTE